MDKCKFDRWPLGINPEMDRHANLMSLPHWSCVSPTSNEWWVRKDGLQHHAFQRGHLDGSYYSELRKIDHEQPML